MEYSIQENERIREHRIPLTEQMLALLEVMKPISGHRDYVFPSDRVTAKQLTLPLNVWSLKTVCYDLRALASTTLNETKLFHNDVIELALAHVDKNQIRGIYKRALYLNQRREMLRWRSNYIEEASKGSWSVCAAN